ncbi:hypothetical protein DTO271G3_7260 [Paecilomyces variotii]|nr:hypothetical protein DTO271G3_7260 [Paecilomyces variotii]
MDTGYVQINQICSNCNTTPTTTSPKLVGWVLESSGRGTLTLITSCLTIIFLCTWVLIHPRVYKCERHAILHKFVLFAKGLLAPEFIAVEGLQEWAQCRRMKRDCATFTGGNFKFVHAFYVSMLAVRYRTHNGDRVIWPNQYTWLLQQGLIDWKDRANWGLSIESIRDKSKADTATKLITLVNVFLFVAESIARMSQDLPLSQLESMTLSYIPLFAVTYFFWWNKPKDILTPTIVDLPEMNPEQRHTFESMAVSNKFDDESMAGHAAYWTVWYLTPRVFEKEAEDREYQDVREKSTRRAKEKAVKTDPNETDKKRLEEGKGNSEKDIETTLPREVVLAHWDPDLYMSKIWPLACLSGASFGALHLLCWNTVFPSAVELWLWRVSALVSVVSIIIFMHFKKVVLRWNGPLTMVGVASPALYLLSRLIMMAEAFATLRAAEPAIYETYSISTELVRLL